MAQHIIDDLTLTKLLGKGSYGEVYLSKKKNSNKLFATKRINKAVADNKMRRYFEYEVKILSILNHPNIVKLEEVKKSQNNYYIVMEYVNGGELSKYLKKYKEKYQTKAFPEEIVQYLMKQILDALIYIHNLNIIHRDLKLENIMVGFDSEKDKEELNMMKAKIKIIDFGFAIILPSSDSLTNTAVGTLLYMDPKILQEFNNQALVDKSRGYGKEADIWSLGCICYELFRGKYPFEAETFDELVNKIRKGKYKLTSTTSANPLAPRGNDKREELIDKISLRTLSECMQEEFIDGPKRDRRLWLGDLRLEAITNYETFKNYGLVKRCLYLFAGTASEDGVIAQSVFTKPKVVPDEASMFDYSLLFIPTLLDYYEATFDKETLLDLLPLAKKQIDIARRRFYGDIINDSDQLGWCFLDWSLTLNKQAGAQAVYIYAENALVKILKYLGMDYKVYLEDANLKKKAALAVFYDKNKGLFTSGKDKQISYATNCWFILSGILSEEDSADLLERLEKCEEAIKPVTPYMYHHYVSALISAGFTLRIACATNALPSGLLSGSIPLAYALFIISLTPPTICP